MPARKSHKSSRKRTPARRKKDPARKFGGARAKTQKAQPALAKVLIVNMIPKSLSGEDHQDSEPSIAVNPANPLHILRTKDFQSAEMMKVLLDRMGKGVDQPYIAAATFAAGSGKKKDRVYVGDNDFNAGGGRTATIDQTLNGADTKPAFTTSRIE